MLGKQLDLSPPELNLAGAMALFHDIGRFEQYTRYRTFVDRNSVNHAEFGVTILREQDMLHNLDPSLQDLLYRVIAYHNRAYLPPEETETCLFFTKLLRDADKLDIWRVVLDYYQNKNGKRNEAIELNLPDSPEISDDAYHDAMAQHIVDIRHLHTLNDFKLLQMAWVYDINFTPSLYAVRERRYLEHLKKALPQSERVNRAFAMMKAYIKERCDGQGAAL